MIFSIVPYNGVSPMKPWPSLAEKGFSLNHGPGETLFFYDTGGNPASGESPPLVIFIHGLGDEADSWRHIIPLLSSRGIRVLALDLPGFGRSVAAGTFRRAINLKRHEAAVLKLIEAVSGDSLVSGRTSAFINRIYLAGNSMGTLIAEMIAIKRPDLVKGLILLDGSIPGGPSNPGLVNLLRLLFSKKWYRSYRNDPEGAWTSLYPYYADLDAMPEEDRDFLRKRVMARVESSSQERAFFATQRSLVWVYAIASRISEKIRNYAGKILLIWGEKDKIIPLSSTDLFRTIRPDAELMVIPGAGHLPHQEKPEETAQAICQFLSLM